MTCRTTVLSALLCAVGGMACASAGPAGDAELAETLAQINSQCPPVESYPKVVKPIPQPWELEGKTPDQLLAMLDTWNPAYAKGVTEGFDINAPGCLDALVKCLSHKKAGLRVAALTAIGRQVRAERGIAQQRHPEMNWREAQTLAVRKYDRVLPDLVRSMRTDTSRVVRKTAGESIGSFDLSPKYAELAGEIVPSILDPDEDVAQGSSMFFGTLLMNVSRADRLRILKKAVRENARPRGRGSLIGIITSKLPADEQRELIPLLLFHMGRIETRDKMFSTAGRPAALALLAKLGEGNRIEKYVLQYLDTQNHKIATLTLRTVQTMGVRALPIQAELIERINGILDAKGIQEKNQAYWRKMTGPVAEETLAKLKTLTGLRT